MTHLSESYYLVLVLVGLTYMGLTLLGISRWLQWLKTNENGKKIERLLFFVGFILQLIGLAGVTYFFFA